jgi:hypothetical protein
VGLAIMASAALAACSGGVSAPSAATSASALASAEPSGGASASASGAPSAEATSASSGSPAASGASTGPCALLTPEEVGAVVGVAVAAVASGEAACVYEVATTHAVVVYTQQVQSGGAVQFEQAKANPEATTVEGVGDEAVWLPAMEAVNLYMVTGDKMLSLALGTLSGVPIDELPTGTSPEVLLDKATQLATLAIARL